MAEDMKDHFVFAGVFTLMKFLIDLAFDEDIELCIM